MFESPKYKNQSEDLPSSLADLETGIESMSPENILENILDTDVNSKRNISDVLKGIAKETDYSPENEMRVRNLNKLLSFERNSTKFELGEIKEYTNELITYLYPERSAEILSKLSLIDTEELSQRYKVEYRKILESRFEPKDVDELMNRPEISLRGGQINGLFTWPEEGKLFVNYEKAANKPDSRHTQFVYPDYKNINFELIGIRNTIVHEIQHLLSNREVELSEELKQDIQTLLPPNTKIVGLGSRSGLSITVDTERDSSKQIFKFNGLNELMTQAMTEKKLRENGLTMVGGLKLSRDTQNLHILSKSTGIDMDELEYAYFNGGPEVVLQRWTEFFDGDTEKAYKLFARTKDLYTKRSTLEDLLEEFGI